jgi:translation initiation factor RLI1
MLPNGIMTAINDYYHGLIKNHNDKVDEEIRVRTEKLKAKENEPAEPGVVYWKAVNSSSTFKFKYPPREGSMTQRLVDSVIEEPGITKKEFYEKYGMEYRKGHNTQFFGSIKDAGIVAVEKGPYGQFKYYLGPNYDEWKEGKLKISKNNNQQRPWNW